MQKSSGYAHDFAVFIARCQPPHLAHVEAIRMGLSQASRLIVVLGSDKQAQTIRNPFTTAQRTLMLRSALADYESDRVDILPVRDTFYNDTLWVRTVQEAVDSLAAGRGARIKLVGHKKDAATSAYLRMFPQWGPLFETGRSDGLGATEVREHLFNLRMEQVRCQVPHPVYDFLVDWVKTPEFERLKEEYAEVQHDKAAWAGSPYQPIFVTTDAVVVCGGHVLVVRRRGKYGRGLIALPGGYINGAERLVDSCIRELKEETGIRVPVADLRSSIVDKEVFDHPNRDLRGRIVTHAFCIKLHDVGELPHVKGMDDADKAWWMRLNHVRDFEQQFFADHYHIIDRFINKI